MCKKVKGDWGGNTASNPIDFTADIFTGWRGAAIVQTFTVTKAGVLQYAQLKGNFGDPTKARWGMYIMDGITDFCFDDVSYTGNSAGLRTSGSTLSGVQTFTASFSKGYNQSNGCRLLPGVTYYLVLELEDVTAGTSQPETYIEGSTSDVYSDGSLTQGERHVGFGGRY